MPLSYRILGRRPSPYGIVVDLEWRDEKGSVLRRDLVEEAKRLREQADKLDDESRFVPDQVELPVGKDSEADVAEATKGRAEPIARTLGLKA